uniref:NADH-ubiquinone oxidoreductase chain 1 n=1 Tax=Ellipes minuta TaxID=241046 RepID=E0YCH3_9ORTH|nr:NADH dehydrogenase subunit 1 [Ellipes minuta]ADD97008.1 NADH dehydrogenase subunit 1 [Ellipes minuta]
MLMIYEYLVSMLGYLITIICVLIGVAFLTLLERSVLGYIQIRKGPNKVGAMGLIQPFSDAIKLFTKEQGSPCMSNYILYYFSPIMGLFIALIIWLVFPYLTYLFGFKYGVLYFLCCSSLGVYCVMIAGWSSNSNYSLLGSLRAIAQTISYEVSMALIVLSVVLLVDGFNMIDLYAFQRGGVWFVFMFFPLFLMWFTTCLAETNRTPFDFAEGESELVSGFNVEYSSGGFALIFLAEYAMILFMSVLISLMFLGGNIDDLFFFMSVVLMSFGFIWARGTLPRYRYDKLMDLAWKCFLPITLSMIIFYESLSILLLF